MNILFTICGRAGSKGFKNKNLKELRGLPLSFYTLAGVKGYIERHPEDYVVVALNTDSEPLADILLNQKKVPIRFVKRKPELAGDIVPKVEVIKDTLLSCIDFAPDLVIDLDITSPMRRIEDIENTISVYKSGSYDLVFSVVEARRSPYFNMVEVKPDGFYRKICNSSYTARQQAPKSYEMNASIYAYSPNFLKSEINKTILDYNCGISVMPDYLVLDIDSEDDFRMMNALLDIYLETDEQLNTVFDLASSIE